MIDYYERRAAHYDAVYERPERQPDLRRLATLIPAALAGRRVPELAAGTGYWTVPIAATAASVHATDANPAPLAIARGRDYPRRNVTFAQADAYRPDCVPGDYDAAFAGFWWSHIPGSRVDEFLAAVCHRLPAGAVVVFTDNRYVEGSSTPIAGTTTAGDTYQLRTLPDGSTHEVLKNFPTPSALRSAVSPYATDVSITELGHFWLLTFRTRA